ncbi:LamG-like jellyroll fold domain-containing protein [Neorhodopirellula pilleata]|uniref:Calcineurin-like phosphoesterase n=1 Tax=Neorhodopirellula pilleata TaxID=2714738 RepID=A0A5C6A331_9BACT|nr:LamG-like jellyroll fold domain-containing protein [Neorhodopirellula pilleata]TWT94312.1 Calcineurin-like phosphoesterase [Neorhodopirellula pilleata]
MRSLLLPLLLTLCVCTPVHRSLAHDDANDPDHQHGDHPQGAVNSSFMTTRDSSVVLPPPKTGDDVFHFVVYGDRTGGVPEGLKVLEQAVKDTNLLDPDLVMTVGDLIQGYNESPEWMRQMREYKAIADRLKMKWYPVAGNHDVYWRGEGPAPQGHHEANYEKHFGPLWYSFRHKNAGFIALYSDEGDARTNLKAFNVGALQNMSAEQLEFLDKALEDLKDVDHVFVFLHHPRWIGGGYTGSNWPVVEKKLVAAGNVSAVFAGHVHHMRYDGPKNGIEYYTLATTGGALSADIPDAGYLHHLNMVTVRKDRISVSALPIGSVIDPKQFTAEFLAEVDQARTIRPRQTSGPLIVNADGTCQGEVTLTIANPTDHEIAVTLMDEPKSVRDRWLTTLDHRHSNIAPGKTETVTYQVGRDATAGEIREVPAMTMQIEALTSSARVRLPEVVTQLELMPGQVPANYFEGVTNRCLLVDRESSAVRVDSKSFELPDGPMTLEAWVSPKDINGFRAIVAKTESSEFSLFSDEGVPQFSIHLNGGYVIANGKAPMKADQWTHLAGVFDGRTVSLFVDGTRVEQQSIESKSFKPTEAAAKQKRNDLPLYLGADPDPRGNPTRGMACLLDEVRLSKVARYDEDFSPEQRHAPDEQTVLLFHLDRTIGPFVLDHSSSAALGVFGLTSRLVER